MRCRSTRRPRRRQDARNASRPTARLCPTASSTGLKFPTVKPKLAGIIIRPSKLNAAASGGNRGAARHARCFAARGSRTLRGARRRLVRWETGSRGARAPRSSASARSALCARSASMSTGSGSHVPMWVSRRALADWVTLIASRIVAAARNATAFRTLLRSVPCQRIHASCTTSSAAVALPRKR
jgi:hypothetical protein